MRKFLKTLIAIVKESFFSPYSFLVSLIPFWDLFWPAGKTSRGYCILFVHGYLNSARVWKYHGNRLEKAGFGPIYTVSLGWPFSSIETFAKKLDEKIRKISCENIIIIGHSMGGIVASYYAWKYEKDSKVRSIMTLGSPFKGTKMAFLAIGKCGREMRLSSSFSQELLSWIDNQKNISFYNMGATLDHIVVPFSSSFIKRADHYLAPYCGHVSLLYRKDVNHCLQEWLQKEISSFS